MLNKVIRWASEQDTVRVMLLTSSRACESASTDQLSDYDITFFTSDLGPLTSDDQWLYGFGRILVSLPERVIHFGQELPTRLVIYEDGTKVDFTLSTVEILAGILRSASLPDWLDIGYKVLLDKEGLTKDLMKPSFKAYIPRKPKEHEFKAVVNEFWWETTYVAKNLWRDEILAAKYSSDWVIRFTLLMKMLEWYVQSHNNWQCRTGIAGKGMKKLLNADRWNELTKTFAGADIEENWDALLKTIEFFRRIAVKVADDLGYEYLHELDKKVSNYLARIRNLKQ